MLKLTFMHNYANPSEQLHCYPSENEHVKDRIIYVNPLGYLNYFGIFATSA